MKFWVVSQMAHTVIIQLCEVKMICGGVLATLQCNACRPSKSCSEAIEKTQEMSASLRKKKIKAYLLPPPPHPEATENPSTLLSAAIVRVNQIPFYKGSKTSDTQFQAQGPLVIFTIESKLQKDLFVNVSIQIHS